MSIRHLRPVDELPAGASAGIETVELLVRLRADLAAERDALHERTRRLGDLEAEVIALLARWGVRP